MKKIILLVAVLVSFQIVTNAQATSDAPKKELTKEEKQARRDAEQAELNKELELTPEQIQSLKDIYTDAGAKSKELAAKTGLTDAEKEAAKKVITDEKNAKIKALLGDEKYKQFLVIKKRQKIAAGN